MYICRLNENIEKLRTVILKSLIIELIYMFEKNISAYGLGIYYVKGICNSMTRITRNIVCLNIYTDVHIYIFGMF